MKAREYIPITIVVWGALVGITYMMLYLFRINTIEEAKQGVFIGLAALLIGMCTLLLNSGTGKTL
jgi:hypothetical protein